MTKYKVWLDGNGQISEKSVMHPIDGNDVKGAFHPTPDMIAAMRPVDDEEIKAWDPKTNTVVDFRASDTPRIARMRKAMKDNSYDALRKGFFGAEVIDENDTFAYNVMREAARAAARPVMNAGANAELMFNEDVANTVIVDVDTGEMKPYMDVLLEEIQANDMALNEALGVRRDGWGSDIGSGVGSLGAVVAMSALGGHIGATAAIAGLSLDAGANAYVEGMEGGLDNDEAWNRGAAVGISNAALERIGIGLLWKSAGRKIVGRAIHGFITEGSEESAQSITEDMIMNKVRGKSIEDIFIDAGKAGLIGGVLGGAAGTVAGGNVEGLKQLKADLVERGLTEPQAEELIKRVDTAFADKDMRTAVIKETLEEQIDKAKYPNDDFKEAIPVLKNLAETAVREARNDVDIRQAVKDRTVGADETTQNIVADSMQSFADVMADKFGITQREFLEKTGFQANVEQDAQPRTFADGTSINENGEFVDADGKVLFQRVGRKGATAREMEAFERAAEMEKAGYDMDTIKNSTGWSRGLDGKMWLETGGGWKIDTDILKKLASIKDGGELALSDIVSTDNFARYPQLADAKVRVVKKPAEDFMMRVRDGIVEINPSRINVVNDDAATPLLRALVHETDHLISRIEGFSRGSNISEAVLKKQVEAHKKHLFDGLEELGVREGFESALESQGEEKSYLAALDDTLAAEYAQADMGDAGLRNKLKGLRNDAIIIDRYGEQALSKLSVADKKNRLREAYRATIGELYARRAEENANTDAAGLQGIPDAQGLFVPELDAHIFLFPAEAGRVAVSDASIEPDYTADTINIDGVERTVYNSRGERIAATESGLRNFWAWFGDSKVVDEQGRPLVVYHGTNAEFDTFLQDKIYNTSEGSGFYFINKKDTGEGFGNRLIGAYLKLENPQYAYNQIFLAEDYDGDLDIMEANDEMLKDAVQQVVRTLESQGYEFYPQIQSDLLDTFSGESQTYEVLDGLLDTYSYLKNENDSIDKNDFLNDVRAAEIKAFGIDGYRTRGYAGDPTSTVYVAFESNQIKSTDNTGEFNPADGNIYHQDGNAGDVRGYFDWTNKMQQIIQIMKTGDLDTVLHELGHFFSVNYIHTAIETGKTDALVPLMQHYGVSDPRALMADTSIQEDLAVKFLTYLKTDQSPRGFRKYFDAARDWLQTAWQRLRGMGLVQDGELPDEIVRFFDDMTIVRPKNLNLDRVARERAQLKDILRKARNGSLESVSAQQLEDLENLIKAATARIPRMPRSLYSKLWGGLNTQFAETHDLAALMGVDEKHKHLMTRKSGGISDENALLDFLTEEGFMFGDRWDNTATQDMQAWDEAMALIQNARTSYSIDDAMRVEEINQLRQAKEDALDILDGMDPYEALSQIEGARKSSAQLMRAAENTAKMRMDTLEKDYKRIQNQNRKLRAKAAEMQMAHQAAVNFLYAQDLPTDTKARFLRKLSKVRDIRTLGQWMGEVREKAHRMYSEQAFRAQRERLNRELKETFTRNKNNIKYDYEHNKLFTDLRRYNTLSAEAAQKEIWQFYEDTENPQPLSREDELRKMFLNYRVQRGQQGGMSAAFMDELIGRIQEAKLIGKDAIDEIQFNRGVNRLEIHEGILDAIAKNKDAGKFTKGYVNIVANLKSTLNAITDKSTAEHFDMVGKEIRSAIDGRKRINETLDMIAEINGIELPKSRGKRDLAFWKYKQDLLEPIEGLRVWYKDHNGRRSWYDEKGFSRGQIMNMYNQYKDPKSRELMDMFYGEDQIKTLIGYLSEKELRTADLLMDRLGDIYSMVNPVYVQVYQRDMPHKQIYWPRQSNHETNHDLLETFDGTQRDPNFTKSRSHGAVPVFFKDALSIYQAHEKDAQYMVHQAVAHKELADIFGHSTIQAAIRNKFGSDVVQALNKHIQGLSIGGLRQNRSVVDDTIGKLVGTYGLAKVAINPRVFIGQLSGFAAYANNMPVGQYMKDFAAGLAGGAKTAKYMKKHVGDYLENRMHGGFNETLRAMMDYEKFGAKRARLNQVMSSFVRGGDYTTLVFGGYPRLKALIEETDADGNRVRTEQEAAEQWIKETEESQQSSAQASLSDIQRGGGAFMKFFTMFKSSQSQFVRKMVDAKNQYARGEISKGEFTKTIFTFGVLMPVLFTAFGWAFFDSVLGAFDDEEDDRNIVGDMFTSIATGALDAFPVIGDVIGTTATALTGGYTSGPVRMLGLDDAYRSVRNLGRLFNSESYRENFGMYDATKLIAPFVEMTIPLPVATYNRYLNKLGVYDAAGI